MPVREALIRLAQEDFLEMIPHVGAKVTKCSEKKLKEIHQIRIELEGAATRLLAQVITESDMKKLSALIDEGKDYLGYDRLQEYFAWNQRFHYTIAEMNPNRTLEEYIKSIWSRMHLVTGDGGVTSWRSEQSYAEHILWVDALRLRDPAEAERACRRHCSVAAESNLASFPAY